MEGYDKEYISRIQDQAEGFRKISKWMNYSSAIINEIDLSRFNGVILKVNIGYLYDMESRWNSRIFIIKDTETMTIYCHRYEQDVLAIAEVSTETFEYVIQEDSNITKWLSEEKKRKAEKIRKNTEKARAEADDVMEKKSIWKRMGF